MFNVGDKIVYPMHGAGTIDSIEEKNILELLEEVQRKVPDIVLPSTGIIDNEVKIDIHGSDYIKKEND